MFVYTTGEDIRHHLSRQSRSRTESRLQSRNKVVRRFSFGAKVRAWMLLGKLATFCTQTEIAPPQSFHDLRAFQVKAATHRFRREVRWVLFWTFGCHNWLIFTSIVVSVGSIFRPEHSSNVHQETTETFSYFVIEPMMKWGVDGE